jgi:hypothetical protein
VPHRLRHHYPQGRAAEPRTSLRSPSFAVRNAAWITAQTRSLVDEFITGARTIWTGPGPTTNSLAAGRVICGSGRSSP